MGDYTVVYFTGLSRGISVPSILAQFNLPFFGEVTIRWYGAIIAFGFFLAVMFGGRMAYKWKMSIDKMLDVLIYGTFGGIIGARLYYVIFQWSYYKDHLSEIFKIWNGGLAIYGGLIGGIIAAFITCKFNKLNFYNLLDIAGMSFLIGQGIGRWGNFTNQEAFGTNTTRPWGMTSQKVVGYIVDNQEEFHAKGFSMDPAVPVHPTFLYESIWCIAGFFVLYLICKKFRKFSGQIFLCYGVWYGLGRVIIEGFRTDSLYVGNTTIRISQILSAVIVVVCAGLLVYFLRKYDRNPKPIEGVDYFPAGKGLAIEESIFGKNEFAAPSEIGGVQPDTEEDMQQESEEGQIEALEISEDTTVVSEHVVKEETIVFEGPKTEPTIQKPDKPGGMEEETAAEHSENTGDDTNGREN